MKRSSASRSARSGAGVEAHLVAVTGVRGRGWLGQRPVLGLTVDRQICCQRLRLLVVLEVREDPVGAGIRQGQLHAPDAVLAEHRVHVLEALAVAAHDDDVHALLVLDLEVAHRAGRRRRRC